MLNKGVFIIYFLIFSSFYSFSQDKGLNLNMDSDTFFVGKVPEVKVFAFKNKAERRQYLILKRRVFKVYPYALLAKDKLLAIESALDTIPKKRKKKKYVKYITKWVKESYSDKLKKLTKSEGRILVKLIYRETNLTSYQIVRSYRGRFNAFFWQSMAKIWDNNLKTKYDPINVREDELIEHILLKAKSEGRFR